MSSSVKTENILGTIIDKRYKLIDYIGQGSFGDIILGTDLITDEMVAIKLQKIKAVANNLESEYKFYQMIGSAADGFPHIHYFGKHIQYNVMVMELLGLSLQSVFNNCDKQFSLKTIIYVFLQILQRIERVHNCYLIFRDIKPENFLMGRKGTLKENVIHIIDFGLARQYWNPDTQTHIPMGERRALTGTTRYMSINSHLGKEQSRRDDLESIGYMMMYFLRQGNLPWMGLKAESIKERNNKILLFKRGTSIETLCYGYPEQFANYFRYVRQLEFDEAPDYRALKKLFIKLFQREGFEDDGYYDWN